MRPFALALGLLAAPAAHAGALDGFYEVTAFTDATGARRSAEELRPEGCWSREVFAIQEGRLSRGHQRRCDVGRYDDTCEAWVTTEVRFDGGLVVPQAASVVSRSRHVRVSDLVTDGEVVRTLGRRGATCEASLETARFDVTMEERDGRQVVLLTDVRRKTVWELAPAKAAEAPFREVAP